MIVLMKSTLEDGPIGWLGSWARTETAHNICPSSSAGLERRPHKSEVVGSNPTFGTNRWLRFSFPFMCGRGGSDRKNIPPFHIALVEQWQLAWPITKRRGSNPTGATIAG